MTRQSRHGPSGLADEPEVFRRRLLEWFDANRRDLPWRAERTPYGTWISEIMLQQTTVRTVIPYFTRFLEMFPDVQALAMVPVDEVLGFWSGLGYYRRARHLHQAARFVVDELDGRLPTDRAGWAALPGIGAYASGAIASMACGERVPALDANANRVLTRWAVADPGQLAEWSPASLRGLGEDLVDPSRPGDWNEAVMELGALVCTASEPSCASCPMSELCRAAGAGHVGEIPASKRKQPTLSVVTAMVVVTLEGRVLLFPPGQAGILPGPAARQPSREDFSGLHLGFWSLPATAWFPAEGRGVTTSWPTSDWCSRLGQTLGFPPQVLEERLEVMGEVRHGITRYRIRAEILQIDLPGFGAEDIPVHGMDGKTDSETGISGPTVPTASAKAVPGFFAPGGAAVPVSRLVTKALSACRLTKG